MAWMESKWKSSSSSVLAAAAAAGGTEISARATGISTSAEGTTEEEEEEDAAAAAGGEGEGTTAGFDGTCCFSIAGPTAEVGGVSKVSSELLLLGALSMKVAVEVGLLAVS